MLVHVIGIGVKKLTYLKTKKKLNLTLWSERYYKTYLNIYKYTFKIRCNMVLLDICHGTEWYLPFIYYLHDTSLKRIPWYFSWICFLIAHTVCNSTYRYLLSGRSLDFRFLSSSWHLWWTSTPSWQNGDVCDTTESIKHPNK